MKTRVDENGDEFVEDGNVVIPICGSHAGRKSTVRTGCMNCDWHILEPADRERTLEFIKKYSAETIDGDKESRVQVQKGQHD